MTDGEKWLAFICLDKFMTTQAHAVAIQAQDVTTQANWEVGPRVQQNASSMASCLRDFTIMNPPMFFGYKVN